MSYLDTSVLTSYYCDEERGRRVQKVLSNIKDPTVSPLVEVEFYCSVARKMRAGAVERSGAEQILSQFRSHLADSRYRVVAIATAEFNLAADWIARLTSPLRVLDALHLAAVFNNNLTLITADKDLARAAKTFGVKHKLLS